MDKKKRVKLIYVRPENQELFEQLERESLKTKIPTSTIIAIAVKKYLEDK